MGTVVMVKPSAVHRPDKVLIKFFADVMYVKGVICFEEYDAMMNVSQLHHLDCIVERMLTDDFNPLKRGEIDGY